MKFTYISTALLAIASAVRIESVPVIESPALLVQSEPATQMMAMIKDGEFTPELAEELMAENPEFWGECIVWLFSLVTAQSEPATQMMSEPATQMMAMTKDGEFTPELVEELMAENPEFWGECIVWLFSLVTAQSEPATQMMAMTKDGEFTPELAKELMAENPEFWGECIVWLFSLVTAQSEPATQIMAQVSDEDGHFSADLFREFVAENLN
jgi:hypothetical protein